MSINSKVLAKICHFQGLTQDEYKEVKKYIASEIQIEKGQTILSEGDESDYIYFITSGSVKIFKQSISGRVQILNISTIGESLNDISTFDGGNCAATLQALSTVRLYCMKKEDMKHLFSKFPKIGLNAASVLANKVRGDSCLVEVLSFDQIICRLARLLLKLAESSGERLPLITQQDMASMVGAHRVNINRSLRILEDNGAIRLERRRVVIRNEQALRNIIR